MFYFLVDNVNMFYFLTDDLFQCKIGDKSPDILSIAKNENCEFEVRFTLEMGLIEVD